MRTITATIHSQPIDIGDLEAVSAALEIPLSSLQLREEIAKTSPAFTPAEKREIKAAVRGFGLAPQLAFRASGAAVIRLEKQLSGYENVRKDQAVRIRQVLNSFGLRFDDLELFAALGESWSKANKFAKIYSVPTLILRKRPGGSLRKPNADTDFCDACQASCGEMRLSLGNEKTIDFNICPDCTRLLLEFLHGKAEIRDVQFSQHSFTWAGEIALNEDIGDDDDLAAAEEFLSSRKEG
jgi:hypothetical protein